ncbi:hypothetical protein [Micromonospora sp. S4605]|uniref:hypothetical protein n=1 Tax=Micromonospora sp. S4605 TaxID=1420897 RepID=UPI0011B7B256|nr:hypothetical protein [Micromonospora sp. S4605]
MDRDSDQPPDDLRPDLSDEQVLYDEADIPPAIPEFVFWLGGAVGGGILGNATYDALKAALGALRRIKDGPALNEMEVVGSRERLPASGRAETVRTETVTSRSPQLNRRLVAGASNSRDRRQRSG